MNLAIILISGLVLSLIFHFIGVYANAKKTVWVMIVLMWAGSINIAMSEISPEGYAYVEKIRGKYKATDEMIRASEPQISLYELLSIKKSFNQEAHQ
jgi:hypothetical protein